MLLLHQASALAQTFKTIDHKHIYYEVSGQGAPIVLIPPFPTDHRIWQQQVNGLKRHFQVITLDLSGFGASSQSDGSATAEFVKNAAPVRASTLIAINDHAR